MGRVQLALKDMAFRRSSGIVLLVFGWFVLIIGYTSAQRLVPRNFPIWMFYAPFMGICFLASGRAERQLCARWWATGNRTATRKSTAHSRLGKGHGRAD